MNLLVPLDGSAESETVLPWVGGFLALPETRVRLLHVSPPSGEEDHDCRHYLERACTALGQWRDRVEARVEAGAPGAVILRYERTTGVDLTALRTHCRQGMSRLHFGSVAVEVLRGATRPLLAIGPAARKPEGVPSYRHLLVPLDGSEWSARILEPVREMAVRLSARVTLLHVGTGDPKLQAQADALAGQGVPCSVTLLTGHPSTAILAHVTLVGADLVAMATHGRSGFQRLLLGSVAEEVIHACPVPVLLRRPEPA